LAISVIGADSRGFVTPEIPPIPNLLHTFSPEEVWRCTLQTKSQFRATFNFMEKMQKVAYAIFSPAQWAPWLWSSLSCSKRPS